MTDVSASSYEPNIPEFGPCSVIVTGTNPERFAPSVSKSVGSCGFDRPNVGAIAESALSCKVTTNPGLF